MTLCYVLHSLHTVSVCPDKHEDFLPSFAHTTGNKGVASVPTLHAEEEQTYNSC